MGTQTQPISGATTQEDARSEERRNLAALDSVISETERAAKERLILRRAELDYKQRLATAFAKSGCFADIRGQSESEAIARALVKIELGEAMGFTPAESMTGIDIIQGRVAVGANLRAARMQRAGFSWPQMLVTDKGCWIPLYFKGAPMTCPKVDSDGNIVLDAKGNAVMVQAVVSYTENDAKLAGLLGKDNYRKNPTDMYFARAITRAQRRYGPGVLGVDVLDTYEARDVQDAPVRESATLSIDQFKPSADPNRGHDATMPESGSEGGNETEGESPAPHHLDGTFTPDTLPDPMELEIGTTCLYQDGGKVKHLKVEQEEGEAPKWVVVEEAPAAPKPAEDPAKQQGAAAQQGQGQQQTTRGRRAGRNADAFDFQGGAK